ncbi:SIS domain-containing protein (plasmid) [Microvirga sp. RSM25]|uniref:KpsF/GutQ family sugar-phosphate isomerase n=1 Tax=Microvirga sp. RSM25 TaxID=3273802 RepID=UPI003850C04C
MLSNNLSTLPADSSDLDEIIRSAVRTVEIEIAGVQTLASSLRGSLSSSFRDAVNTIFRCQGQVIATGMGKSGHIAKKFAATLASTGTVSNYVHPAEASHGDLGMIGADDVIIAFSWSGETRELVDLVAYSRRFNIKLIAVTSNPLSTLGSASDVCLTIPKLTEACPNGLAPTTSTTVQLVLADAIAMSLLSLRGFSPANFQVFHPGGKLGASLKTVRDLMHSGDKLPIVTDAACIADAIIVMTEKSFGIAAVLNKAGALIGVVTDGDLRRGLRSDILNTSVIEIMTTEPIVIGAKVTAAQALNEMNSAKITALMVVDDNKLVGILHVHDLLRTGVI